MSHRSTLLIACAALGAALIDTAPLQAQQTTTPPATDRRSAGSGPERRGGPPGVDERVGRLTTELGLTAEQATRVRAILTAQQRGMDSVFARRTAAHDAERASLLATHTNTQKAMAAILTPDQRVRHDALRARQGGPRSGMRHRGPDGGARGGRADRRGDRGDRGDRRGPPSGERRGPPNDGTAPR